MSEQPQTAEEIARVWAALPQSTRDDFQQLIARDLPDTAAAVIVEVDEHELDADEATIVGEHLATVVLSTGHMYGLSFVPRPPGALLH
jgi:hypothetical protein